MLIFACTHSSVLQLLFVEQTYLINITPQASLGNGNWDKVRGRLSTNWTRKCWGGCRIVFKKKCAEGVGWLKTMSSGWGDWWRIWYIFQEEARKLVHWQQLKKQQPIVLGRGMVWKYCDDLPSDVLEKAIASLRLCRNYSCSPWPHQKRFVVVVEAWPLWQSQSKNIEETALIQTVPLLWHTAAHSN